ncbi:hypothetical protein D3C83_294110 [compost metagenome]
MNVWRVITNVSASRAFVTKNRAGSKKTTFAPALPASTRATPSFLVHSPYIVT